MARTGTTADARGLTVTTLVSRHLPWAGVVELRTDPPGRFAADVQAVLADGSVVTLPAVPAEDLPHLESLRARH
nr:PH domain-containing protein [Ornithinimicrobium sp. F0845]